MTNLNLEITHYLDDWFIQLSYAASPQLSTTNNAQYQWVGTLTFLVQWYPVPEMKTNIQYDKDGNLNVLKNSP